MRDAFGQGPSFTLIVKVSDGEQFLVQSDMDASIYCVYVAAR